MNPRLAVFTGAGIVALSTATAVQAQSTTCPAGQFLQALGSPPGACGFVNSAAFGPISTATFLGNNSGSAAAVAALPASAALSVLGLEPGGSLLGTHVSIISALTISAPAFNSQYVGLYSVISGAGAMTSTNTLNLVEGKVWPFNYMNCSDTATATSASLLNPIILNCAEIFVTSIGNTASAGDRDAIGIDMIINGSATQVEGASYYNAMLASLAAETNLGGTVSAPVGDIYGFSTQYHMLTGATFYASIHGEGQNILGVASGASVTNKLMVEYTLDTDDAVHGANMDNAILFDNNGSAGWTNLIELGFPISQGGSFPVTSTGTLWGSYQGGTTGYGLNWSNITFTSCAVQLEYGCFTNSSLVVGQVGPIAAGMRFQVHGQTNENFVVLTSSGLGQGITLESLNDAASSVGVFQITGSLLYLTTGGIEVNGSAGVNSSTCTAWQQGLCVHS